MNVPGAMLALGDAAMPENESSQIFEQWLRSEVVPIFDRVADGREKLIPIEEVFAGIEDRYQARKS